MKHSIICDGEYDLERFGRRMTERWRTLYKQLTCVNRVKWPNDAIHELPSKKGIYGIMFDCIHTLPLKKSKAVSFGNHLVITDDSSELESVCNIMSNGHCLVMDSCTETMGNSEEPSSILDFVADKQFSNPVIFFRNIDKWNSIEFDRISQDLLIRHNASQFIDSFFGIPVDFSSLNVVSTISSSNTDILNIYKNFDFIWSESKDLLGTI